MKKITKEQIEDYAVRKTGDETISGVKTFSSSPLVPAATTSGQAVNKGQLDTKSDIPTGTSGTSRYLRGDNSWQSLAVDTRAVTLTVTPANTPTATGDSIQTAVSRLQGQINANMPRQLKDFYTDVSNVGTSLTDLYSFSIPANTISANGQKITASYYGTIFTALGTVTLAVYFNGTVVGAYTFTGMNIDSEWKIDVFLIRVSSTVCRTKAAITNVTSGATFINKQNILDLTGQSFAVANVLKVSAQSNMGSGEVVAKAGNIVWHPAAP